MIDSFKNALGYIFLYTLKYTPVVGAMVQKACNDKVCRKPHSLAFIPDILKTQEMCIKALEVDPWSFKYVPDNLRTWEVCEKAVNIEPWLLVYLPDNLRTQGMQEMYDKARRDYLSYWLLVPDFFATEKQYKLWHANNRFFGWWYDYMFIEWYEDHKKRKAQKPKIKEELMPIAWHPLRWWDWCVPEDGKRETEKLWK